MTRSVVDSFPELVTSAASAGTIQALRLAIPAAAAWVAAAFAVGWSASTGLRAGVGSGILAVAAWGAFGRYAGRHRGGLDAPPVVWLSVVQRIVVAALVCASGAFFAVAWRVAAISNSPVARLAAVHQTAYVDLRIDSDPQPLVGRDGRVRAAFAATVLRVDDEVGPGAFRLHVPVFVVARDPGWFTVQPSQRVRATAHLSPARERALEAAVADVRGPPTIQSGVVWWQALAGAVRRGVQRAARSLPAGPRGLLPGIVDGDTTQLAPDVQADFATTGMTHLVAVSGTNLAIFLGAWLGLLRRLTYRRRWHLLFGVMGILAFVVVARPQPSVLRAGAMGLIALLGSTIGSRLSALAVLSAASLLLIYANPALARSYGFALSVIATASLLVGAPPLSRWMGRRIPAWLAAATAVPLAAALGCAPLIVSFTGRVSVFTVPANLLAEAAVGPATILGILTGAVAVVWPWAGSVVAHLAGIPCAWIIWVAHFFARLPGATMRWPSGFGGALSLAVVEASAVLAIRGLAARRRRRTGKPRTGPLADARCATPALTGSVARDWPVSD
ncbi:MAG: ComEC/Rec2 family competence protein [Acidothermus cellulolyticus]|nr:ComEC/Rec2 family competence protein [Acidothermus cellulolyticus]